MYRFLSDMAQLHLDVQFKCRSMKLLKYMKMMIKSVVESSYEFDTSRAPDSISRNTGRAQALLANTTFIYRVRLIAPHLQPTEHRHNGSQDFNSGGRPRYPYRHPIIQKVVNITWFQNEDDIGVIFHDYFAPIPFEAIALVLTVVRSKLRALILDCDGLYTLSSDRELHRRVDHWHIQRVQLERSGLQNQLRFASQLAS
jgi:hypothetical protein